jgi:endonuclease YncB( thermonuclease family)
MLTVLAITAALLLQEPSPSATVLVGRVVSVTDGDTIDLLDENKTTHRIRLHGIDAPERAQPFSRRSRQHLADAVFGREVDVEVLGKDKYGRTIGRVLVEGDDVCLSLIRAGLAWHYVRYDQSPEYAAAEAAARAAKRGLWLDPHAIPPWDWRQLPKADRDAARKVAAGIEDQGED